LGARLLAFCLQEYGSGPVHLDVIASNSTAVRLYQRHGFITASEYLGYSGTDTDLPCYHMLYTPQTADQSSIGA
jgi:ribosomal protein S18 acetylase RimI-like enzyme